MEQETGPFSVSIDFDQSHLFFPNIIHWVLVFLALSIVLVHGREIVRHVQGWKESYREHGLDYDRLRLFGTFGLVIAYFLLMNWVGQLFPNTGMGFLLVSMPFMALLSLLYVHDLDRKKFLLILANSVIAPLVAWYVLAQLFYITLP
ncbi:tripartite tricarboxylate transporter TctB family protein [Aliiruegeria lutimaris]|uniref:Tripartite tricarboxylate transporter TctB family protein n=1 Tax=Aliiruegeria lutimaris TaxID=571298 RepID=A0A1G8RHN8_9RHOB|nr:tripartite tricarboxylate transporter TctB family protein [Aliiruegeria lutimaris]SDJ16439.1 Tripartite tricarboxylate transporter TctB family protein [Aliiruegeria lutimaris]